MAASGYFQRGTFEFLRDLKSNNDRAWFTTNKPRYEQHVKDPALRFIEDFTPHLKGLSSHFNATPRSLFRIHRDVRFSKDKSPYKTHTGIHFRHEQAKNAYAPGYYLHIEPGSCFAALGIWHPEAKPLRAIREHMVAHPDAWSGVVGDTAFADTFDLEGERLKRAPKGFDPDHALIEDLKRKDFIAVRRIAQSVVTSRDLPARIAEMWSKGDPLMRFLCDALSVPF